MVGGCSCFALRPGGLGFVLGSLHDGWNETPTCSADFGALRP
jgi:hypothetical protein